MERGLFEAIISWLGGGLFFKLQTNVFGAQNTICLVFARNIVALTDEGEFLVALFSGV